MAKLIKKNKKTAVSKESFVTKNKTTIGMGLIGTTVIGVGIYAYLANKKKGDGGGDDGEAACILKGSEWMWDGSKCVPVGSPCDEGCTLNADGECVGSFCCTLCEDAPCFCTAEKLADHNRVYHSTAGTLTYSHSDYFGNNPAAVGERFNYTIHYTSTHTSDITRNIMFGIRPSGGGYTGMEATTVVTFVPSPNGTAVVESLPVNNPGWEYDGRIKVSNPATGEDNLIYATPTGTKLKVEFPSDLDMWSSDSFITSPTIPFYLPRGGGVYSFTLSVKHRGNAKSYKAGIYVNDSSIGAYWLPLTTFNCLQHSTYTRVDVVVTGTINPTNVATGNSISILTAFMELDNVPTVPQQTSNYIFASWDAALVVLPESDLNPFNSDSFVTNPYIPFFIPRAGGTYSFTLSVYHIGAAKSYKAGIYINDTTIGAYWLPLTTFNCSQHNTYTKVDVIVTGSIKPTNVLKGHTLGCYCAFFDLGVTPMTPIGAANWIFANWDDALKIQD